MRANDISFEWCNEYVAKILQIAAQLESGSVMQASMLARAEAVLDMLKAFREKDQQP